MQRLTLKAATTATTDQGTFDAVISAGTVDREKDIVDPAGMVRALRKWAATGKMIPLAWQHSTKAEDQIGYIDPATVREENGEVVARGWVDQSTEVGSHAWRLVKTGTLGFSFGYLVLDHAKRMGGGRHIKDLDVFEITATNVPMHNSTRVLGWKSGSRAPLSLDQLRELERAVEDPEQTRLRAEMRTAMLAVLSRVDPTSNDGEAKSWSAAELRERCRQIEAQHGPLQIVTFDAA